MVLKIANYNNLNENEYIYFDCVPVALRSGIRGRTYTRKDVLFIADLELDAKELYNELHKIYGGDIND